jgi:hypothetical protein
MLRGNWIETAGSAGKGRSMSATLSSALGAIESNDRETAMREYASILHAIASEDREVRERASNPETVLKLRSIMAAIGKTREDVARDEAMVAQFHRSKNAARGYRDAGQALVKAELAAEAATAQYEKDVAEAAAKRNAVWSLRDSAISANTAASACRNQVKKLFMEAGELFTPEHREYAMLSDWVDAPSPAGE